MVLSLLENLQWSRRSNEIVNVYLLVQLSEAFQRQFSSPPTTFILLHAWPHQFGLWPSLLSRFYYICLGSKLTHSQISCCSNLQTFFSGRRSRTLAWPGTMSGKIKNRSEETQTLRAGCSKVELRHRRLPGGAGWPKFNQLEMVTTFTYKSSLVRIDARNFELSW